ncbi:MAG: metallophosphoesterase family protein [Acutalibacteraceae bacterium]
MAKTNFFLITDTHYFAHSLNAYGEEYEQFMDFEQKCYAETADINDSLFQYLKNQTETDTILIAGDLSFNGEKASHEEFSQKLCQLKNSGKKVFVVTAGHDIDRNPFQYNGGPRENVEGIKFEDLYKYYKDFGFNSALDFNKEHLSYVADISEDVRLLVLCNDTKDGSNLAYDGEFLEWIKLQCRKAQADGKIMIAMEHYPLLPGQPIFSIIGDSLQKDSTRVIEALADNGVHACFTGHMHNMSINETATENGNKFYDICTGSVIGCPAFIRFISIENGKMNIESRPIPEFTLNGEKTDCKKYLENQFDRMIRTMVSSMRNDPLRFMGKLRLGNSRFLSIIIKSLGTVFDTWTIGKFCKLFFIKPHKEVKNMKISDVAVLIVRNLFGGNQPYTEGTPLGDTLLKFFKRLNPVFKILNKKIRTQNGDTVDLYDMLKNCIGNYGIDDYNTVIDLQ